MYLIETNINPEIKIFRVEGGVKLRYHLRINQDNRRFRSVYFIELRDNILLARFEKLRIRFENRLGGTY